MGFGWTETLLIFGVILLVFGPNMLPELARNLGSSVNVFKEEVTNTQDSLEDGLPSNPLERETTGVSEIPSPGETSATEPENHDS